MTSIRKLFLLALFFIFTACGSDVADQASSSDSAKRSDSGAESAQEKSAQEKSAQEMGVAPSERADGVVYEDEIYAGWPYQ